jgi:hypothetical protein
VQICAVDLRVGNGEVLGKSDTPLEQSVHAAREKPTCPEGGFTAYIFTSCFA